jgi:hypothetical protein
MVGTGAHINEPLYTETAVTLLEKMIENREDE